MDAFALLCQTLDLRDYPDYAVCNRANEYPGLTLCEYYAAQGMRYTVPLGYAASIAYFYLYHRPRLSFADRSLSKLHHYFFPSAGYSTPVGILAGIGVGLQQRARDLAPAALDTTAQKEKADALMASQQYAQRRHAAEARLCAEQPLSTKALVWLRLRADPVAEELHRLGLGEAAIPWTALLVPHGVLWTSQHSVVHDPARYKDYNGPVVSAEVTTATALSSPSSSSTATPTPPAAAPPAAAHTASSKTKAYFTKPQMDALVSRVATLRTSPEEDRWMRSAGRFSSYGILTMLLAWNTGNALFRLQMGLGLGVTVGAAVSATRLDQMFVHM